MLLGGYVLMWFSKSAIASAEGARFILVATRSVHAMIWALFFVAVFGPGALAGTLAIAVHSIGFTGKFLSEAIEEAKPGPIEALKATGAPPLAVLIKGVWPQVQPAFLALGHVLLSPGCGCAESRIENRDTLKIEKTPKPVNRRRAQERAGFGAGRLKSRLGRMPANV